MSKVNSTAKVVDGSLVLSLPDALVPVVMRLSLDEAKSAAFTVKNEKDQHVLCVHLNDKDIREIAPYDTQDKAVSALMAASDALERGASVHSSHSSNSNGGVKWMSVLKWGGAIMALIFVFMLIGEAAKIGPRLEMNEGARSGSGSSVQGASVSAPKSNVNPREVTGAAVSADDFLNR